MIFSSLVFLCVFLPLTLLLYTIAPSLKIKNAILIVVSLIFYAYGEPIYVLLMIFSSFFNYLFARWIEKTENHKKPVLILAVILNLGILGIFKYTAFLLTSINGSLGLHIPVPEIVLPIGISFFTFQALSYVIDVYYGKAEVQTSFWRILLYVSFFPQLIAGPIVKYRDISAEIADRTRTVEETAAGLRRFICGLAKKVFIANAMGQVADHVFDADLAQVNMAVAWLGAVAYMLQIYYDFSGYSDMAIGLGKMFGFHFKENFRYPYGAVNIQDFWRKWHISLSTWFKEYLYIPLGGNRKGKARTYINRIIVFFLTGLWHGANWTFVLWGLYHGVLLLLEECVPFLRKMPKVLGHIYSLVLVCIGFVMFRADTVTQGWRLIGKMFTGIGATSQATSLLWQQLTPWFLLWLVVALIGMAPVAPLVQKIQSGIQKEGTALWKCVNVCLYVLALIVLAWSVIRLSGSSYNPFIYFRF